LLAGVGDVEPVVASGARDAQQFPDLLGRTVEFVQVLPLVEVAQAEFVGFSFVQGRAQGRADARSDQTDEEASLGVHVDSSD